MIRKGMFIGDRYEVIDKVGSGGMSDVYKAKDHKLNRFVAVKVLKSEFCEDKGFVSKFKIEAQSAAGLAHPNIVNVYDVGEDQGIYYIVMELIEGITLKKYIEKKGKLPVKDAISIAIQVAQGIEAAHNNHIVHRDIKPQNIIISREGKVKVTDFGIARAASANTINSNAMGSVHYISPEQARGGYIDEKSDIYSLGITLYEMITGRVPFEGDSTVTIALQHIQEEIPSAKMFVPDLPVSVAKIIEKCAQKKPERRYLKVSSLIADLKKSLISPDEDFVVIAPATNNNATIMITDDEISVIKENAGKVPVQSADLIDDNEEEMITDDDEWMSESDDIDEGNPKLDKVVAIGGIVAAVVILIVAILAFSSSMKNCGGTVDNPTESQSSTESTDNAKNAKVPDLYEMTEDEAIAALSKEGLKYKIETSTSEKVLEGLVMAQSVKADTVVSKGTTITITISEGGKEFEIPDVVGKTYDEVQKILGGEYGLEVAPTYEQTEEYENGIVFKTNPEAPIKLKRGDKITVYVSLGEEEFAVVPSVVSKTEEAARKALEDEGFVVKIEEDYSDTVSKGRVISMDRDAGAKLPKGETITITISLGKEQKETETTTVEADKLIASFGEFKYKDFENVPSIFLETSDGSASEEETTPVENETNEGETSEGETGEGETTTSGKTLISSSLSAYVKYTAVDGSEVSKKVTDQLSSTSFSTDFKQSSNIEIEANKDDVKDVVAYLYVELTYTYSENGEEKTETVVIYTDEDTFGE